ncbi:uncharacterized protein VTP21DRAFT_2478 [Calcarisporiella thermophila]|uniref:uncharacterized protein n=1 Tax=Calcarisporiella thermophila TaxID=911321 RepID=UPI0037439BAA
MTPSKRSENHKPKGILKRPSVSTDEDKSQRLKWDEDNIMITEAQRGSTMKINEPKTPYIRYNPETDEVITDLSGLDIPSFSLGEDRASPERRSSSPGSSLASSPRDKHPHLQVDDEWDENDEEDEETKERHRKFKEMRSQHYNMRDAMRRAREMLEHEDEEDKDVAMENEVERNGNELENGNSGEEGGGNQEESRREKDINGVKENSMRE